jgi:hypothetical protein
METPTFTCATCDATVTERPVFHLGLAFCCAGCAADGPCMCSYDAADLMPDAHGAATTPIVHAYARADEELAAALAHIKERVLVAVEA